MYLIDKLYFGVLLLNRVVFDGDAARGQAMLAWYLAVMFSVMDLYFVLYIEGYVPGILDIGEAQFLGALTVMVSGLSYLYLKRKRSVGQVRKLVKNAIMWGVLGLILVASLLALTIHLAILISERYSPGAVI